MKQEFYQKVAYIGLDKPDGSLMLNVPLYVKVSEINANGVTDMQEELIHRITEIALKRYQKQISQHLENLKKGVQNNDNSRVESREQAFESQGA